MTGRNNSVRLSYPVYNFWKLDFLKCKNNCPYGKLIFLFKKKWKNTNENYCKEKSKLLILFQESLNVFCRRADRALRKSLLK